MRSYPESAYRQQNNEFGAQDYTSRSQRGGSKMHLVIALLGMGTLGFMLWTIAKMLNVVPG